MTPVVPPLVDRAWLADHRCVLADVRWYLDGRSGRAAYEAGHLPGAVFVDVDTALATHGRATDGRHPLPAPEAFAAAMAGLGIGDDDVVVGYDDDGGVIAARLVWMLRATGHPAALLDGGLRPDHDELVTEPVRRPPARFTSRPWPPEGLAELADAVHRGNLVLDARDPDRYRGDREPVDPRAGHIPGARNLPARANLTSEGFALPVADLRARFAGVGVQGPDAGARLVSSCGSGVTACHTLLLLEHAGLGVGRLYAGSWSAYSSDPALPVATGDEPG